MCVSELRTNIELTSVFLQSHRENHTRHTFNAKSNVSRAPLNCFFFRTVSPLPFIIIGISTSFFSIQMENICYSKFENQANGKISTHICVWFRAFRLALFMLLFCVLLQCLFQRLGGTF